SSGEARPSPSRLLAALSLLRAVRAVSLWAHHHHSGSVVSGTVGRTHLPDEGRVASLVRQSLREADGRRLRRLLPALDGARARDDGGDGIGLVLSRARFPQALPRLGAGLLSGHRQPDRALDP